LGTPSQPQLSGRNTLGVALRAARKERGYSRASFAVSCRLACSTVQLLENGKGRITSFARAVAALELEIAGRNLPAGETLGAQLAALRKRRGLTQRELAQHVGATANTVRAVETSDRGRVETLDRMLAVLGAGTYLAPVGSRRAFYSHAGNSSVHHGWATPPALLERLYAVFGHFDLDPCSPTDNRRAALVKARVHFTPEDDGLSLPWHGSVFANPPYGRELRRWVRKARLEAEAGRARPAVLLLPARTDTGWWHDDIAGRADVYLLRGRLAFGDGEVPAPFPSALAVWGAESEIRTALASALGGAWHVPASTSGA
jgi:phage N-6-adenine-methyltransferase